MWKRFTRAFKEIVRLEDVAEHLTLEVMMIEEEYLPEKKEKLIQRRSSILCRAGRLRDYLLKHNQPIPTTGF